MKIEKSQVPYSTSVYRQSDVSPWDSFVLLVFEVPIPPRELCNFRSWGFMNQTCFEHFKIYMLHTWSIYIYITRKFACLRCSHPGPLDDHSSFNAAVDWLWPVKRTWPWRTRFRKLWMLVRGWRVGLRQPVLAVRPSCIPSSLRFQCLGGINHTVFFYDPIPSYYWKWASQLRHKLKKSLMQFEPMQNAIWLISWLGTILGKCIPPH